jgi:hypothetical protein
MVLSQLRFGNYICSIDNHTFSQALSPQNMRATWHFARDRPYPGLAARLLGFLPVG